MKNVSNKFFTCRDIYIFFTKHWSSLALLLFGIFLIFIRSTGSLDGDEAIYAQVARETLARDSWLTLYWRGEVWLEKPPLFLWFEMIMMNLFGFSEVALRFTSGLFGVLTVVLVYAITYTFFKNKKSAFIAGLILFSVPLFVINMRYGMTDIMVTFFIVLAVFSAYMSVYSNIRWLRLFSLATGCAVMTKGVVGVFPIIILFTFLIFARKKSKFQIRELIYSLIIFMLVVVPWHLYMSIIFGMQFWSDYLGYHVIDRFAHNIIASPYDNYIEAVSGRFGSWLIVFFILLFYSKDFIKKYTKESITLLFSASFIIIGFSLSSTVSPHYILPAVPFLAIFMGGIIGWFFKKQDRIVIILAAVSMLNFMPLFILLASDYGESNILVPRIIDHFLQIPYFLFVLLSPIFLIFSLFFYRQHKQIIITISFYVLIIMNIFVPFYPNRSQYMKDIGNFIVSMDDSSLTHVFMSHSDNYLTNTLLFYLPINMTAERIRVSNDILFEKNKDHSLCITLHKNPIPYEMGMILYTFPDGELRYCSDNTIF